MTIGTMALPPSDSGGLQGPSPHHLLDTLVALDFQNLNDPRYLSFICDAGRFWKAHANVDDARDSSNLDLETYHLAMADVYLDTERRGFRFWKPATEGLPRAFRPEYPRDVEWYVTAKQFPTLCSLWSNCQQAPLGNSTAVQPLLPDQLLYGCSD